MIESTGSIFEQLGLGNQVSDAARSTQLDQSAFFKLMTVQMSNQDPTAPLDSNQFFSQLAQFSTVEAVQTLQGSFEDLAQSMRASQVLQASTMVGRAVLLEGDNVALGEEGQTLFGLDLTEAVSGVVLNIEDSSGQLVRSLKLGPSGAGIRDVVWDGLDQDGVRAEPGYYNVTAVAEGQDGPQAVEALVWGGVQSVSLNGAAGNTLHLSDGRQIALDEVRRVG